MRVVYLWAMKNTLVEIQKCKACQMELLPYRDFNGDPQHEKEFCDLKCREAWGKWEKYFIADRWDAMVNAMRADMHRSDSVPVLDLSL